MTPTVTKQGKQHSQQNDRDAVAAFRQATAKHIEYLDSQHIDNCVAALLQQAQQSKRQQLPLHMRYHYDDQRSYQITAATIRRFQQLHSDQFDLIVLDDDQYHDPRLITFDVIPK